MNVNDMVLKKPKSKYKEKENENEGNKTHAQRHNV